LDMTTYSALVEILVRKDIPLPIDTFARIVSTGFMGEQYIALDPGGSEIMLKADSQITMTQGAIALEELIGQFLFNQEGKGLP
jgi:phospholipid/cholesterol/gamma-HCH transport system substrate-binding protein